VTGTRRDVLPEQVEDIRSSGPFEDVASHPLLETYQDIAVPLLSLCLALLVHNLADKPISQVNSNHIGTWSKHCVFRITRAGIFPRSS
jgi:hypothetical protein